MLTASSPTMRAVISARPAEYDCFKANSMRQHNFEPSSHLLRLCQTFSVPPVSGYGGSLRLALTWIQTTRWHIIVQRYRAFPSLPLGASCPLHNAYPIPWKILASSPNHFHRKFSILLFTSSNYTSYTLWIPGGLQTRKSPRLPCVPCSSHPPHPPLSPHSGENPLRAFKCERHMYRACKTTYYCSHAACPCKANP